MFLGTLSAGVMAARSVFGATVKQVGVQLYTVRGDLAKDFDGTLAQVAAIGYKEVEFAGYFGHTPQQVQESLKRHGLVSPSAHLDFAIVSNPEKWKQALDDAATIGQKFLVNPWIDESMRNEPGVWKRIADVYNTAGAAAKAHGIQFCYHNHNFEFYASPGADGKLPFDVLLDSCEPKLVKMELDLCWISAAGKDPLEYFHRYAGRFPLVHVKGLRKVPAASETPVPIDKVLPDVTDVGHDDVVDWKRIFAKSKEAGIQHYFVEHDIPKDPAASLKASYEYLSHLSF